MNNLILPPRLSSGRELISPYHQRGFILNPFRFGTGAWTPAQLYTGGTTDGFWFDPYDLSTLFQDSAGTTPVTTGGQPVGLMLDKSGNGNHAYQPTSGLRPTFNTSGGKNWVGVPSGTAWMFIGSSYLDTNFSSIYIAGRTQSGITQRVFIAKPHAGTAINPFYRWVIGHEVNQLVIRSNGTSAVSANGTWPTATDVTVIMDNPGGIGSVQATNISISTATQTYPNNVQAYLFAAPWGDQYVGRAYGIVCAARTLTAGEKTDLRTWIDAR